MHGQKMCSNSWTAPYQPGDNVIFNTHPPRLLSTPHLPQHTLSLSHSRDQWDVVVCDPPSFAPSKQTVEAGRAAYERVFALAAKVTRCDGNGVLLCQLMLLPFSVHSTPRLVGPLFTHSIHLNLSHMITLRPGGLLALASCSSHIPAPMFNEVCEEAVLGSARRQAQVLAMQVGVCVQLRLSA